jgi:hypothetical protein
LDLAAIFRLLINSDILREAMVDPMASLSVPATHTLINTDELGWIEIVCSMLIKVFYEIIHRLPPIFLGQFTLTRSLWLTTSPHGFEEVIGPLF